MVPTQHIPLLCILSYNSYNFTILWLLDFLPPLLDYIFLPSFQSSSDFMISQECLLLPLTIPILCPTSPSLHLPGSWVPSPVSPDPSVLLIHISTCSSKIALFSFIHFISPKVLFQKFLLLLPSILPPFLFLTSSSIFF